MKSSTALAAVLPPVSTTAPTVRIRALAAGGAQPPKPPKPTLRTSLRELERSLFDAFEMAQRDQFER